MGKIDFNLGKKGAHPKCWASVLGQCKGPLDKEHLFSEALYSEKSIHVDGAPWLNGPKMKIGRSAFTSNILCKGHNNKLSKVDKEAVRFRKALSITRDPMKRPNSKILQPPPEIKISGTKFGQWLCKTHCNIITVTGGIPELSYVQYAFGERTEKKVFFYFIAMVGEQLQVGREHYTYIAPPKDDKIYDFITIFSGIKVLVTTTQINAFDWKFIDRLNDFQLQTALGLYKIHFDWSNEPQPLGSV